MSLGITKYVERGCDTCYYSKVVFKVCSVVKFRFPSLNGVEITDYSLRSAYVTASCLKMTYMYVYHRACQAQLTSPYNLNNTARDLSVISDGVMTMMAHQSLSDH